MLPSIKVGLSSLDCEVKLVRSTLEGGDQKTSKLNIDIQIHIALRFRVIYVMYRLDGTRKLYSLSVRVLVYIYKWKLLLVGLARYSGGPDRCP